MTESDTETSYSPIARRVITRLKLRQLRLLVAISDKLSILHAAKSLNMSQPTATKLLRDLEEDVGVQLFSRTNRGVVPTEYGSVLVRHGRLVLAQIAHAAEEIESLNQGMGGRVVVGTLLTASAMLLPRAIARLRAERPDVAVFVQEGTNDLLMPELATGDLDLVIGRLSEFRHREAIVQEHLFDEPVCLVTRPGHPLSRRPKLDLAELTGCDWILPPPQTTLRRQLSQAFLDRELQTPKIRVESVSFLTNRSLLEQTDLIGVFPYHVVAREVQSGLLTVLPCELGLTSGPVGISRRRDGELSPAAAAFLDILRELAREPMPTPVVS